MYINELSFDPHDPLYEAVGLPGVRWGIQVFTTHNLYALDPEATQITTSDQGMGLVCDRLSWAGQQKHSAGRVEVQLSRQDGATQWEIKAWHAEPIKVIKLLLWDLPEGALAQGWWTATSGEAEAVRISATTPMRWRYPWPEWLTPWACAGEGPGAICVSIRDAEVRAKRLYAHVPPYAGRPVVELIAEEDAARWTTHFSAPPMRVRICWDAAEIDADWAAHLAFVEKAFRLPLWETRADLPAWVRDVRLVLNLHGQHWTGYVFNTFERMAETLRWITQYIPGEYLLAYMPGWEGRYYYQYPCYQPGEDLGGEAAFRGLLATARQLHVHVMPMFGMHGANVHQYPDWERAAFRSPNNRFVKLVNLPDWDTDRAGEDDQVFLNPGEPRYQQHLLRQVSAAVEAYDLEGVFLDTSACWFNDPRYNLYAGYQSLIGALHQRHPHLLVAGEGWYDALLGLFPVNQSWLGVERHYRRPELLTRYARALGHLSTGTPGHGSTGVHEGGFYPAARVQPTQGHIPALGIVDDTLVRHSDEVTALCRALADGHGTH